jgi:tellurite resistance protein
VLIDDGILQALILLRLLPWIMKEPFSPAYCAFTFGATALAAAPLRLMDRGATGPIATLAPMLFIAASVVVGAAAAVGTIWLLASYCMPIAWAILSLQATETAKQP